jgi:alpha-1,6-mannosyltransferase
VKSLHLTNYWHAASGGIRTWYRSLLTGATSDGRSVRLIVPDDHDEVEEVGSHGRIYHLRSSVAAPFDRRYRLLLPHRYLLPAADVMRIIERERPDLVEICDRFTLNWLAGLLRTTGVLTDQRPMVVGLSCDRLDDTVGAYLTGSPASRRAAGAYCRWCYTPLFDAHIAVSPYVGRELQAAMHPRHVRPVEIASPGVEVGCFSAAARNESLRAALLPRSDGRRQVLMLYAGRLSPEKNLGLLVETLALLAKERSTQFCLLVAGSGPLEGWLREQAGTFGAGQLRLVGQVAPASALAELCATVDLFLHSNPREPFGLGPLEAMAAGCPVVLPAAGGVLTYATRSNSWLAEPTAAAFAGAVLDAAAHSDERARRAVAARVTADHHSAARAVSRAFGLYDAMHATWLQSRAADPASVRGASEPRSFDLAVTGASPGGHARPVV